MQPDINNSTPMRLRIVGASVRSLAWSANFAQIPTIGMDLFADLDTQNLIPIAACPLQDYPDQLFRWIKDNDAIGVAGGNAATPWMFTGGLENYLPGVERMSAVATLLGPSIETLHAVRDLRQLAPWASAAGLAMPTSIPLTQRGERTELSGDSTRTGKWLLKRPHSSGGLGVQWHDAANDVGASPRDAILQKHIEGDSWSALFCSGKDNCQFIGVSRQLHHNFLYAGSVGPLELPKEHTDALVRFGMRLTRAGMRGIWGADLMLSNKGRLFLLEVNPRWTASVEVYERSLGRSLLPCHIEACLPVAQTRALFPNVRIGDRWKAFRSNSGKTVVGKKVVYACQASRWSAKIAVEFDRAFGDVKSNRADDSALLPLPLLADIPEHGANFPVGAPVCTVFYHGVDESTTLEALQQRESFILSQLNEQTTGHLRD